MPIKNRSTKEAEAKHTPMANVDPGVQIPKEDEGNWLVSYADMMTLLCGFFVMLFSMAKMDAPKYDSFKQAMAKQFGGEYVSPTKELAEFVTQVIKEAGLESGVVVKSDALGVSVVFESTVFFDTLSSDVTANGKKTLSTLIAALAKHQATKAKLYRIVVEGHTDNRPIIGGIYPSNWELSGARAARVVRMFLDQGFEPDRLTAIGYADTHPQYPVRTPDGRWDEAALGKNRRVVVRMLEPRVDSIPYPEKPATQAPAPAAAANAPATPSAPSAVKEAPRIPANSAEKTAANTAH
jgi:chemotaxis protein MotB